MKFFKRYHAFIVALVFCFLPVILLCLPGLRNYVFETWHVAAFYSSIIIVLYLTGVFIVIFSFIEINKCVAVLRKKNAQKHSYLLGNANQIVFSPTHGLDDDTIATLYESMDNSVNRKQNQSLAGVMTCANLSTMIGLLGTFAGLSMTIASVITLLEKSQMTAGNEADTLGIIVGVVSSLSEPLKGMNTAFVSSIYGVVSAILLNVVCSFLRGEFTRLAIDLRNARLDFVRESHKRAASEVGKTKTLRLITDLDDVIKGFKAGMFEFQERLAVSFDSSNSLLNSLLNCVSERSQKSELFSQHLINAVQQQNEQLQQIDRHAAQSYSALINIGKETVERIGHVEASLGELYTIHEQHDNASLQRHRETVATLDSQSQTFEPLLGQIAGMHRHLQKEINVIKGKENDE